MLRHLGFLIAPAWCLMLCASTAIAASAAGKALQRVPIVDPSGFERPMVASTVLVPSDWATQGGIVWNVQSQCGGTGYNIDFRAASPDGRAGLHFLPMDRWQWSSIGTAAMPGCRHEKITTVRQYLEGFVQQNRPYARILDYRPRPDIAEPFQQLNQVTPMPMGQSRSWVEGGEVLIGYSQAGVEVRETIATAAIFNLMTTDSMMGMPGTEVLTGSTLPGFSMRAPDGELNFQLAETIRSSGKPNPDWERRIAGHNAKIAKTNIDGARARSKITAKTYDEISKMQADSWRLYNESSDYLARERSEAIRGVETYDDPYHGGTVELDNTYNNAWQLNDGTNVLTNDEDFNPYATFGQDGQRLEVTE